MKILLKYQDHKINQKANGKKMQNYNLKNIIYAYSSNKSNIFLLTAKTTYFYSSCLGDKIYKCCRFLARS